MPWFEGHAGNRMWYEDRGSGPSIIFIHGWCMSSAVWELQRTALAGSFRMIAPDLRGHGSSPTHSDGFHISGCAADIAALIEQLNLSEVILAGWSLGAFIAIETYLLCKGRVAGLVLISATPRFVRSPDFPYGVSQVEVDGMGKKVHRNMQRALKGFVDRMFAPGEMVAEAVQNILSRIPLPHINVTMQALQALAEADLCQHLSEIAIPTLVLNGDCDPICLPQASEFMAARIPGARQIHFSGCGHAPFLTQSIVFNVCLDDFRRILYGGKYRQD